MPFWKKSEDPWDQKPEKRRLEPKEPKESPIDSLKRWNEERKAEAKEREEAKRLPPEKCPWCGKDMEQGYLLTGRDTIRWYPGIYKYKFALFYSGGLRIDTQGDFTKYRITWLCRNCKKMVFDMPEFGENPWAAGSFSERLISEEMKEEEQSGE